MATRTMTDIFRFFKCKGLGACCAQAQQGYKEFAAWPTLVQGKRGAAFREKTERSDSLRKEKTRHPCIFSRKVENNAHSLLL